MEIMYGYWIESDSAKEVISRKLEELGLFSDITVPFSELAKVDLDFFLNWWNFKTCECEHSPIVPQCKNPYTKLLLHLRFCLRSKEEIEEFKNGFIEILEKAKKNLDNFKEEAVKRVKQFAQENFVAGDWEYFSFWEESLRRQPKQELVTKQENNLISKIKNIKKGREESEQKSEEERRRMNKELMAENKVWEEQLKNQQEEWEKQERDSKFRQTICDEISKKEVEVGLFVSSLDPSLWSSYENWIDKIYNIDIGEVENFKNQILTAIDQAKKDKEEERKQQLESDFVEQQKQEQELTARQELTKLVLKKTDSEPWISLQNDLDSFLWQGFTSVFHKISEMNFKEFASFKDQLLTAIQEAKKKKRKQEPTTPNQQKDNQESNQKLFEENQKRQVKEFILQSIAESLRKNNLKISDLDPSSQNYQEQINNCEENKLSEIEERIKKDIYNKVQKLNRNNKNKNPDQKDKQDQEKNQPKTTDKFTDINDKKQLEKIITELKKEIRQLKRIINPNNPAQKTLITDKENQLKQLENKLSQFSDSDSNPTKLKNFSFPWLPSGVISMVIIVILLAIVVIRKTKHKQKLIKK